MDKYYSRHQRQKNNVIQWLLWHMLSTLREEKVVYLYKKLDGLESPREERPRGTLLVGCTGVGTLVRFSIHDPHPHHSFGSHYHSALDDFPNHVVVQGHTRRW
jgi:hypothetical protein